MKSRSFRTWFAIALASVAVPLPSAADLVGHWTFDESSGTNIADTSGLGNHGVLFNPKSNTWTNGMSGGALYFEGTTGAGSTYVTIPDAPSLHITNAISFAAWIRCDDISLDAPILDKEGPGKLSYWFGTYGAAGAVPGNFGMLMSANGIAWTIFNRSQGAVSQGLWVHVASTWDGSTVRHYLNGVLLAQTAAFSGPLHVSDASLIIGANVPYNATAFKGIIDDARLYNHALTLSEVRSLAGMTPQLVGHWTFDESSGTNIADTSGLGNHGVLINPKSNTRTNGMSGGALYFDGTTGVGATYVAIPDAPSLHIAAGISFAAWARCDDINNDAPILAKEGPGKLSYWFGTYGAAGAAPGNFGMLMSADGNAWTANNRNQGALPQGQWVHLASTWDGATIHHYFNGRPLPQTGTFAGPIQVSDAFLAIGENSLQNFTAFKGALDEVRLYNYALNPDEIVALYVGASFNVTAITDDGTDVRLTWECVAGRSYVVQTNAPSSAGGLSSVFGDLSAPIAVPPDFAGATTNYLHSGGGTNTQARYYRVKLLP